MPFAIKLAKVQFTGRVQGKVTHVSCLI
uniref:Uncharacterized protein n=1 Tax=Rhizophora mucronata TaxID=61149 RepID=A0A2P2QF45_RHIMU